MLSVICPIYNEEKYIAHCIDSILQQDYPKSDMEILLVDGMSKDRTREIVEQYTEKYSYIRLLDNLGRIAPCAMNIGIREAKGDIVIRIDAHASYQTNYFSCLCRYLQELKADNVGAVCRTDVLTKTPKSLAICEVLSNRFGVGNSIFRTGVDKVRQVDTVPFGCWNKSIFNEIGFYDERLVRNQDFELNRRIIKGGGKIYIVPDTYCTYYVRETFKALWRQNYLNGLWGIRTVLFTGAANSLALRHYIPMIFVLSLILPLLFGLIWWPFVLISAASLSAYILANVIISVAIRAQKHLNIIYLICGFAVLHISNGIGMIKSFFTAKYYVKKVNARGHI